MGSIRLFLVHTETDRLTERERQTDRDRDTETETERKN